MSTQNLPIAAPIAAFIRSTSSDGVISLSGSDKVVQLLAVIATERPDEPLPMMKTAAGHFATYIGVTLPDLRIAPLASAMQGFGPYLAKFRRKNDKKLGRNSVRSYVNYAQMLLRLAVGLGWLPEPSKVEPEWRALLDGVDWGAMKDGARLRYECYKLMRFAVSKELAPGNFSDEHLKAYEDLKVGKGRHPKYAKSEISQFRLGITKAGLRERFPKISHSADDRRNAKPIAGFARLNR